MALTAYSGLIETVADWLNRGDLTAAIPTFITLAEAEMNRKLRVQDMVARCTATFDDQFTTVPSDFAGVKNIQVNGIPGKDGQLKSKSPAQLDDLRQRLYTLPGTPRVYAVIGRSIEVAPTPATACTVEMAYYQRIPALSEASPTNWLLTKHPDLYLYGTLAQSAPYLHDDERAQIWVGAFDRALDSINADDRKVTFGDDTPVIHVRPFGE